MDDRLRSVLESAVPFALPLARRFRGLDIREGMLIRGPRGWGEFAPFDDYTDAMAGRWLASALETAHSVVPAPVRAQVESNAIIASLDAGECAALARDAALVLGCSVVKLQVGSEALADDEARVAGVRDALDSVLGRGVGRIRLDAKARWSPAEAIRALRRLGAYGIEYVEQPCATPADLAAVRSAGVVPIAVDESIRLADRPGEVRAREFADIAILKPAPLGGIERTLAIAEELALPVVVSGSLDSSVGLSSVIHAAASLPGLDLACGVGTGVLLADDLVAATTVPASGHVPVEARAPELDCLLRARDRVSAERAAWWRQRLVAAWNACDVVDRERVVA